MSLLSQGVASARPPMNNYPASTKNATKPSGNRFMNITADDVGELEGNIHTSRNGSFVVNLLQKKTPAGTKIGTKVSSYRTIEEARIRDSNDQPDAPK